MGGLWESTLARRRFCYYIGMVEGRLLGLEYSKCNCGCGELTPLETTLRFS